MSHLEDKLWNTMMELGVQEFYDVKTEYRFHPTRRWRFDFAIPDIKLGIEAEGGTWIYGRHSRATGFMKDCEKYNEASLLGWRVLRFTKDMIMDNRARDAILRATSNEVQD